MSNDTPYAHIYAQEIWHCDAVIIGNRDALRRMAEAIAKAITTGDGACTLMAGDGEGYGVIVLQEEGDLCHLPVPYTDEVAREQHNSAAGKHGRALWARVAEVRRRDAMALAAEREGGEE